jgi:hypothetical protein
MFYVEWLRVRNAVRILAIVLGIMFGITVLVRLFMPVDMSGDRIYRNIDLKGSGMHRSIGHLSNGATRTTFTDSQGDRVVIVDNGWRGKKVTVTGPNVEVSGQAANVHVGPVGVHARSTRSGGQVVVGTDEPISVLDLMLGPGLVGLIMATILGGVLGKENRNHLELAWTKPVSRDVMALGMFGVDIAALAASMAFTLLLEILGIALYEMPRIYADPAAIAGTFMVFFGVLAFYTLFNAASASIRGGGGTKALVWLAAIFVPSLSNAALVPVLIFVIIGNIFGGLAMFDPLAYFGSISHHASTGSGVAPGVFGSAIVNAPAPERAIAVLILMLLFAALSLWQWRRLEA